MRHQIKNILKYFPIILSITAISVIAIILIMEHLFNIHPCKLCLYQRIPYYIIIILAGINFAIKQQKFARFFVIGSAILLFSNAILSFYHAGIEYGFFANIVNCQNMVNADSVTDLLDQITNKLAIDCAKPAFIFIFSLSGWNFFLSLTLGIFALMHIFSYNKLAKKL